MNKRAAFTLDDDQATWMSETLLEGALTPEEVLKARTAMALHAAGAHAPRSGAAEATLFPRLRPARLGRELHLAYALAWLLGAPAPPSPSTGLHSVDVSLASTLSHYSWAWWVDDLKPGEAPRTLSARALRAFTVEAQLDLPVDGVYPVDLWHLQHAWAVANRRAFMDPRHVHGAARKAGVLLRG